TGASETTRQLGKSPTIRGGDQPPPCPGVISEARRSRPLCPQKWLVSLADAPGSTPPHPTPPRSSNLHSLETAPPHGTPFNPSSSRSAQWSNRPASQAVRAAQRAFSSVQNRNPIGPDQQLARIPTRRVLQDLADEIAAGQDPTFKR